MENKHTKTHFLHFCKLVEQWLLVHHGFPHTLVNADMFDYVFAALDEVLNTRLLNQHMSYFATAVRQLKRLWMYWRVWMVWKDNPQFERIIDYLSKPSTYYNNSGIRYFCIESSYRFTCTDTTKFLKIDNTAIVEYPSDLVSNS